MHIFHRVNRAAGVNFMLHAAGWLEGGLVSSFEKFVMDCDQLAAHQKMAGGIDMSQLLSNGTPDQVRAACHQAIADAGPGYFMGSVSCFIFLFLFLVF